MSAETTPIKNAEIEEGKLELPIEVVGEHVKSGRKILADYDQATGSIEVRPKYIDLADVIQAKVEEIQAWEASQGAGLKSEPIDPEAVKKEAQEQEEKLEAEAAKLEKEKPKEEAPIIDASASGIDPAILAILKSQERLINKLTDKQEEDEESKQSSRQRGLVAEGIKEARKHRADIQDDIDHAEATGCPLPPKKHPQFGDKTPAYVDWLKAHYPAKYEKRFGVTEKGVTMTIVKNGRSATVTADIARRKTHLTQKPEASEDTLSSDMSWNA